MRAVVPCMCRYLLTALSQYQFLPYGTLHLSHGRSCHALSQIYGSLTGSLGPGQPPCRRPLKGGREIDRDTDGGNDFQSVGTHAKLVFGSAWLTDKIMFCMVTTRTLYIHHRALVKASFI